eukprot:6275828-Amphidinium_carterae.1
MILTGQKGPLLVQNLQWTIEISTPRFYPDRPFALCAPGGHTPSADPTSTHMLGSLMRMRLFLARPHVPERHPPWIWNGCTSPAPRVLPYHHIDPSHHRPHNNESKREAFTMQNDQSTHGH